MPLSSFNTGTQYFQGGFVSQNTLTLNDKQLRGYLGSNSEQMGKLSDNATKAGIVSGLGLLKANPWIGGTVGTLLGLEGLNASYVSSLYNQVSLDYLGQSQRNGLYIIVQEVDVSQMGASNTSYNVQFYFPQGKLFEQINYSVH